MPSDSSELNRASSALQPPPRFEKPSWASTALFAAFLGFLLWSASRAGFSISELWAGLPNMATIGGEMVPPATDRMGPVANAILVTFQMALVGTVIGILLSIPLALLAARNVCPLPSGCVMGCGP